ncbi:SpoIIIAH-like family protein [Ammoniphilus sp. CFH 90114]|uniref:SpoIIIAH-like family protein n=1 Tax=Ammoniphilus sp. CFH 90114 TaxID=2493665 RepID=UPI00100DFC36|nr:SpoIIIAH-like family protein [Ammoniphilus sp. CFH 90114]RXT13782.1 SpoIIIAH-like family protein [Ammoniphilus sp. CFH 90114]
MVLKKQTVWLLSMLTIMVVLSAYYMLQGPIEQVPVASNSPSPEAQELQVDSQQIETGESMEGTAEAMPGSASDYFIETKLNRDAWQSQKMEEYLSIMTNAEDKEAVTQAKSNYDKLVTQQDTEMTVESLIKALGYNEAVIISKENRVNVIVQAEKLERQNAVEIMKLVTQHLEVPSNNIVVTYKP